MADSPDRGKTPQSSPGSHQRDIEGDTPMTDAQATGVSPRPVNTPVRAPRTSLLGSLLLSEYIATPRNSRASSTSSTGSANIVPTPGMAPRTRAPNQSLQAAPSHRSPLHDAQPTTPYPRGIRSASDSASTPGLPAMPGASTSTADFSAIARSSNFRSSVLAGERPMPETPAQATLRTPKEVPERRRSSRFLPRDSLGAITPSNPTHRRASALFQAHSNASRDAEEKGGLSKSMGHTPLGSAMKKGGKKGKKDEDVDKDKKGEDGGDEDGGNEG